MTAATTKFTDAQLLERCPTDQAAIALFNSAEAASLRSEFRSGIASFVAYVSALRRGAARRIGSPAR